MNDIVAGHGAPPGDGTMAAWLAPILAARGTTLDAAQAAARDRLQELALALRAFRTARQSTLTKIFAPPEVPRGVYLWGGVGRSKSFLMHGFFATEAIRRQMAGVVVYGLCRDTATLAQLPLPVYALGTTPKAAGAHGLPTIQQPVRLGDVEVHPGEIMIGDKVWAGPEYTENL